jgi:anthranilate/para-aminobenzoate synthase component II
MATQHRDLPRFGVQFHPESILTPEGPTIVKNFLKLAS